ncbi:MAG TPA: hypothetical protein DCQ64_10345 [Candidatus Rokubacteria bacterium]|nr:hypothetical protein [Candidatus Rokubacteria bacterium]
MEDGFQFGLKERGGVIAGRKVQAFFGDSAGQPAQTRTKAQELVERDHVQVLTGPVAAFEVYAISDYIRRVERREGRLMNVVIDTYRDVSQFWKYEPAAFLAAPVYSRDYPPAKNLE